MYHQRRTEPCTVTDITCTENFVKFDRVVFEICQRTDRQTNIHTNTLIAIAYFAPLPGPQ